MFFDRAKKYFYKKERNSFTLFFLFFARKFSKFIAFIFRVFGNTAFYSVYSENKKREVFIYLNIRKNSFILSLWKDRTRSTRFCFKKRLGGGKRGIEGGDVVYVAEFSGKRLRD